LCGQSHCVEVKEGRSLDDGNGYSLDFHLFLSSVRDLRGLCQVRELVASECGDMDITISIHVNGKARWLEG